MNVLLKVCDPFRAFHGCPRDREGLSRAYLPLAHLESEKSADRCKERKRAVKVAPGAAELARRPNLDRRAAQYRVQSNLDHIVSHDQGQAPVVVLAVKRERRQAQRIGELQLPSL